MCFDPINYLVQKIDGDYAHLKNLDSLNEEIVLVARALLPMDIDEGTKLLWHDLEYFIVE
ncbi:MAG: chorismate--pyruvate lyase [Oscillospiraceae bacterium]|nr:chorismate--pyruvate lyase [Oscillospiraceae bacterium]